MNIKIPAQSVSQSVNQSINHSIRTSIYCSQPDSTVTLVRTFSSSGPQILNCCFVAQAYSLCLLKKKYFYRKTRFRFF